MPVFLKQAATLLAGQMAGSNNKAKFIVKTLRMGYITSATGIALIWYSAYRNERVKPGTGKFPFPGVTALKRAYKPDRPESELPHPGAQLDAVVGKTSQSPIQEYHGTIPTSQAAAKRMQGLTTFEGKPVAAWIAPFLAYAKKQGWKGGLTQGFRSYSEEVSIWNSGTRPAARPGTSNHGKKNFPGGAVDVSEAAELAQILAKIPGGSLLQWAGAKDEVHFSFPHNGGY